VGTQSGNAGTSFIWRLPKWEVTNDFPRNVGQLPMYYNYKKYGKAQMDKPESVFWSHYIDEKTPVYPFGHGLLY
jgi:beta-glucosidase